MTVALFVASLLIAATPLKSGEIVDGVACAKDPSITYAYYLPSHYLPTKRWPILFVFDPRKRGALAAGLFRDAAERYGWIIVSSNNTESDADAQPSIHAIQITLPDAQQRFAVDTQRIYLAGFSGTAIIAWAVADVTKSVAGLIGCSGRPLPSPRYDVSFAWFGTAGTRDFNYIETFMIDRGLTAVNATHRVETFEGPHRWAPADLIERAFDWFELLAMKRGTRARDDELVKRLFDKELSIATAEKDPLAAVRDYETIARTFDGLMDVPAVRDRVAAIRKTKEFARAEREAKRAEEFELTQRSRIARVLQQFLQSDAPSIAASLAHDLDIASLQRTAARDTYEGRAARRVLAGTFAQLDFYLAADATGQKLAVMKAVAQQIRNP